VALLGVTGLATSAGSAPKSVTRALSSASVAVSFLPRALYDIQSQSRTEQQTQEWLSRYSLRAAIESTISEFVKGHGMRQCRYRSQDKAHVQHVLTAIAVNLERIDVHLPPAPARQPRNPTALQGYLDWQHIPRPWRVATHPAD
jgi:hypothetical protein